MFRLREDWRVPYGNSGAALVAKFNTGGSETTAIVGFQSFVQRAHAPQNYDHDQITLDDRLRNGLVCFYGAFEVPEALRKHEIL